VHTPIITSSDCEGAGEVFTINSKLSKHEEEIANSGMSGLDSFFRTPKYLTVSSQLHLEALAQSVAKVWTLSPTFRAEKSDTARHLSEFYMLEAELGFIDKLDTIMDLVEQLIRCLAVSLQGSKIGQELLRNSVLAEQDIGDSGPGIETFSIGLTRRWEGLMKEPWPRITYQQAVTQIHNAASGGHASFETIPDMESGLQAEHERFLAKWVGHEGPVFVTDYPKSIKPFYMAPSEGTSEIVGLVPTVACFDLLMPDVCEVVGGSMREHRLSHLEEAMRQKRLLVSHHTAEQPSELTDRTVLETKEGKNQSSLDWYLDLRRYGSVPHGGFGLGFDRLLCFLAGVSNIRDIVTFPRWYGRCTC